MSELKKLLSGEDISILDFIKKLDWIKRFSKLYAIFFSIIMFLFVGIGLIAKKTSPIEFESKVILLDEQSSESGIANSLSGGVMNMINPLAASSKLSNGSSSGLGLYNLILTNKPFLLELVKTRINFANSKDTTLFEYFWQDPKEDMVTDFLASLKSESTKTKRLFLEKYLSKPDNEVDSISFTKNINISNITNEEKRIIALVSSRIKIEQTGNLITLSVKIPDQQLSAQVTKTVLSQLIKYTTQIKVGKQIDNVRFLERRVAEAEQKYTSSQLNLASFQDNNQDLIYESLKSRTEKLKNDFTLYSTVYNQLISQLEQARIQLKKDMPIFTVVEPIYLPEAPVQTNEKVFYYTRIGAILSLILCCLHAVNYRLNLSRKIKQKVTSKFNQWQY